VSEASAIVVGAGVFGASVADRLAGSGWDVTLVDAEEPGHPRGTSSAHTRVIRYGHGADVHRVASLDDVASLPSSEIWMALEITGTATDLRVERACAIRTADKPAPIAGATPLNGRHRPALDALNPLSTERLIRT